MPPCQSGVCPHSLWLTTLCGIREAETRHHHAQKMKGKKNYPTRGERKKKAKREREGRAKPAGREGGRNLVMMSCCVNTRLSTGVMEKMEDET